MSSEFDALEKTLMVDIIRRRLHPAKNGSDFKCDKSMGKFLNNKYKNFT